jgi:hypothetical protein
MVRTARASPSPRGPRVRRPLGEARQQHLQLGSPELATPLAEQDSVGVGNQFCCDNARVALKSFRTPKTGQRLQTHRSRRRLRAVLNFIAATLVGVGLMLPLGRIAKHHATALRGLLALSGITIAATSLIGLWISENSRLFGFTEYGFRPTITVAIVAESTAIVALIAYLYLRRPSSSSRVQSSSSTVSVSE